jgi:hypothetical protein
MNVICAGCEAECRKKSPVWSDGVPPSIGRRSRRSAAVFRGFRMFFGAVEKTRTSTGCPTATSTLRVYQFRHDREKSRAMPGARL